MSQSTVNDPCYLWDEKETTEHRHCERCGKLRDCELIPLHGYSEWFCRQCATKAYKTGEAI